MFKKIVEAINNLKLENVSINHEIIIEHRKVKIKESTSGYKIPVSERGYLIVNVNTETASYTLPPLKSVKDGWQITIYNACDQSVTLYANPSDTGIGHNDLSLDGVSIYRSANKIGHAIQVTKSKIGWLFLPLGNSLENFKFLS